MRLLFRLREGQCEYSGTDQSVSCRSVTGVRHSNEATATDDH